MAETYQAPKVPVGWIVNHYPHASGSETPVAAIVLASGFGGALRLGTFPAHGRAAVVDGVRHLSDPHLKTSEQSYRVRHGAWDFVGGIAFEKVAELVALLPKLRELTGDAGEGATAQFDADAKQATILELSKRGHNTKEIAEALGEDWTEKRVLYWLRRANAGERAKAEAGATA